MSFAKVFSAQTHMLDAHTVTVEADISRGLHAFSIVGLPDKAVEEARDRMSAAIKNSGFTSPKSKNHKVVISLAPADLKKEGTAFDLGMALAYLLASDDISFDPTEKLFLGELSLDGTMQPIPGTLALALEAKRCGFSELYVPAANAREAALVSGINVFAIRTLKELIEHLTAKQGAAIREPEKQTIVEHRPATGLVSFEDIRGQATAKRGLEIAAAGGHNIALFGPPGTGKTMLAKAFAHILPPLSFDEALEATAIHSIAGKLGTEPLVTHPPFRAPHHTASYVSMVGGGTTPRPGEVTLAHHGVLFLDEFPEFERRVIDTLREPLEERTVSISRAKGSSLFPANFTLIASMNPCPCGNFGSQKECVCTPANFARYQRKVSGPIIDRIDMWIEVPNVSPRSLGEQRRHGETREVRTRVRSARKRQEERFGRTRPHPDSGGGIRPISKNSEMGVKDLEVFVPLSKDVQAILDHAASRLDLSPRAYHRVIKLARTIADIDGAEKLGEPHVLEALQYRPRTSGPHL